MADSTQVGSIEYDARIDTSQLKRDAVTADSTVKGLADNTEQHTSRMTRGFNTLSTLGVVGFAVATVAATALVVRNLGDAAARVDTLQNSARTFEYMGFKTADAAEATNALKDSILGLPTPLDSAVRGMTSLAATYGDVKLGQRVFTALNDAVLGFGGSTAMVDNAILQLSQRPMDGPLDAQTWNSLLQSGLTPVIVAMAKDMGRSVGQLKEDFGSGTLTVKDFVNELTKIDKQGGGGLVALSQIAKNSTSGIRTSFENMNTAITRGLADIITAIGPAKIAGAITAFGVAFENGLKGVVRFIKFLQDSPSAMATFQGAIIGLGIAIVVAMGPAILAFAELAAEMALTAAPFVAIGAAVFYLQKQFGLFTPIINAMVVATNWLKGAFDFASQAIQNLITFLTPLYNWFAVNILPILIQIAGFLGGQLKAAWDSISASISQLMTTLAPFMPLIKMVGEAILIASLIITGVMIGAVIAAIVIIGAIITAVVRWIAFMVQLYTAVTSAMSGVVSAIAGGVSSAISWIASLPGKASGAIGNLGGLLVGSGKALIQGFIDGIMSMVNAVKNAVGGVLQAAKNFFPHSPAKEGPFSGRGWTAYSGKSLMEGFANGISSNTGLIGNALAGMASPVLSPSVVGSSMDGMPGGASGGVVNHIGTINISSDVDGEKLLRRLGRDDEIAAQGVVSG